MRQVLVFLGLATALCASAVRADDLAAPAGPVVLSITGEISHTSDGAVAAFDMAGLQALPQHAVRTSTAWTDGVATFVGPLLCDVLDAVGATGTTVRATALNDYSAEIPVEDCRRYPVILALEQDGEPLSRRGKGPIWVVYPQDDFPELRSTAIYNRWVWQLSGLEVR